MLTLQTAIVCVYLPRYIGILLYILNTDIIPSRYLNDNYSDSSVIQVLLVAYLHKHVSNCMPTSHTNIHFRLKIKPSESIEVGRLITRSSVQGAWL